MLKTVKYATPTNRVMTSSSFSEIRKRARGCVLFRKLNKIVGLALSPMGKIAIPTTPKAANTIKVLILYLLYEWVIEA